MAHADAVTRGRDLAAQVFDDQRPALDEAASCPREAVVLVSGLDGDVVEAGIGLLFYRELKLLLAG